MSNFHFSNNIFTKKKYLKSENFSERCIITLHILNQDQGDKVYIPEQDYQWCKVEFLVEFNAFILNNTFYNTKSVYRSSLD